jgi:hypothetical protein
MTEGGPLQTQELPTSYQVVAVPEDLKIWVRIPGVRDWTEVDLNLFFQGKSETIRLYEPVSDITQAAPQA